MARLTVGLGEMVVSDVPGDTLVTQALGSCVAVLVRDRFHAVCGLAHVVVPGPAPQSGCAHKPAHYASAAIPALLEAVRRLGGCVGLGSEVVIVGGASVVDGLKSFDVGRRNIRAVREALLAAGIVPALEDVDGTASRTMSVDVGTGAVRVRNPERGEWTLD